MRASSKTNEAITFSFLYSCFCFIRMKIIFQTCCIAKLKYIWCFSNHIVRFVSLRMSLTISTIKKIFIIFMIRSCSTLDLYDDFRRASYHKYVSFTSTFACILFDRCLRRSCSLMFCREMFRVIYKKSKRFIFNIDNIHLLLNHLWWSRRCRFHHHHFH